MAKIAKKVLNVETNSVTFQFKDGAEISVCLNELPAETLAQLALHGASAKLGDSYAGAGEVAEEGGDAIAWAKQTVQGVWESLKNGLWSVRSEGGVRVTQLAHAVASVYGISPEEAAEKLADLEDDKKKALTAAPKIAAALAQLKAEAAAKRAAVAQAQLAGGASSELPLL